MTTLIGFCDKKNTMLRLVCLIHVILSLDLHASPRELTCLFIISKMSLLSLNFSCAGNRSRRSSRVSVRSSESVLTPAPARTGVASHNVAQWHSKIYNQRTTFNVHFICRSSRGLFALVGQSFTLDMFHLLSNTLPASLSKLFISFSKTDMTSPVETEKNTHIKTNLSHRFPTQRALLAYVSGTMLSKHHTNIHAGHARERRRCEEDKPLSWSHRWLTQTLRCEVSTDAEGVARARRRLFNSNARFSPRRCRSTSVNIYWRSVSSQQKVKVKESDCFPRDVRGASDDHWSLSDRHVTPRAHRQIFSR